MNPARSKKKINYGNHFKSLFNTHKKKYSKRVKNFKFKNNTNNLNSLNVNKRPMFSSL